MLMQRKYMKKYIACVVILLVILFTITVIYLLIYRNAHYLKQSYNTQIPSTSTKTSAVPTEIDDHRVYRAGYPIVPNIVHYLRINEPESSFIDAVCMLSIYRNHVPSKIYIHTSNSNYSGQFWYKVRNTSGLRLILKVLPLDISIQLANKNDKNFHKLQILKQYRGILLDKDVFVVNNLDLYLEYDMTVSKQWNYATNTLSDRIIVAHKNARFLHLWLDVHKENTESPNFNALQYANDNILRKYSKFVHIEIAQFTIDSFLLSNIYDELWSLWQSQDAIWLMEECVTTEIEKKVKRCVNYMHTKKQIGNDSLPTKSTFFEMVDFFLR